MWQAEICPLTFILYNIFPSTVQLIIVPFPSHNMFRPYTAIIRSTYTERSTTLLHRQGEEPTAKGAYMITTPTYLGTTQ
jgi:hypothetical protein